VSSDLIVTLDAVVDALASARIPYALCGGLAVNLHGHVRATSDIDLLVQRDDLDLVREVVRDLGFTIDAGSIPFDVGTSRERELHRSTRIEDGVATTIDLLIVTTCLQPAWESRTVARWRGREIYCVSLTGLGLMKRLAGRTQDRADLEALGLPTSVASE
jgi:hypothetical protein